jgi:hypothetical protein
VMSAVGVVPLALAFSLKAWVIPNPMCTNHKNCVGSIRESTLHQGNSMDKIASLFEVDLAINSPSNGILKCFFAIVSLLFVISVNLPP